MSSWLESTLALERLQCAPLLILRLISLPSSGLKFVEITLLDQAATSELGGKSSFQSTLWCQ